jgi:hypothetical protein
VSYSTDEGRQQLLDALAEAADRTAAALACLGEAYEHLDEQSAERLEGELFRPLQLAYGRAQRTHAAFAERSGLPTRQFPPAGEVSPSRGASGLLEDATEAVRGADGELAELQDSLLPVEVGDEEVRAGITEVRELLSPLPARARELGRTLGR